MSMRSLFNNILFVLWLGTLGCSIIPMLILLGGLSICFALVHEPVAAVSFLVLFISGILFRVTHGFGVNA